MIHLEECLTHMTHLRDWLRLLDREIEALFSVGEGGGMGGEAGKY